jgi:hypothetical protein
MSKRTILKSQKNDALQIIQQQGMLPEEFEWRESESTFDFEAGSLVSLLVHKPSNYFFQFDFQSDMIRCSIYSPGQDQQLIRRNRLHWAEQLGDLRSWIKSLKREISTPDLWAEISKEKILVEAAQQEQENTRFTTDEIHRVQENLNEIKQYLISSKEFSPEQINYLDGRFKYLGEAAERVGKKDWLMLLLGTLASVVMTLMLPTQLSGELFRVAGTLLKWVAGLHLLP